MSVSKANGRHPLPLPPPLLPEASSPPAGEVGPGPRLRAIEKWAGWVKAVVAGLILVGVSLALLGWNARGQAEGMAKKADVLPRLQALEQSDAARGAETTADRRAILDAIKDLREDVTADIKDLRADVRALKGATQ
jgi:hypothetical protein